MEKGNKGKKERKIWLFKGEFRKAIGVLRKRPQRYSPGLNSVQCAGTHTLSSPVQVARPNKAEGVLLVMGTGAVRSQTRWRRPNSSPKPLRARQSTSSPVQVQS